MGTAVSDVARRHTLSQFLLEFVKFAVGSAIDGSRKIIPGRKQRDKMVPEELINTITMSYPLKSKKSPEIKVANDQHFEINMEEVKEDMDNIKQQYKTSTKSVEESQPPTKSGDGDKGINLLQKNGRRVFIRSRL